MNYKTLLFYAGMILILSGCASLYIGVPEFHGTGPHNLGGISIELKSVSDELLEINIENRRKSPASLNLTVVNRLIKVKSQSIKVRIGTEYIERCADNLCWLEEVPVYETRQVRNNIYSDLHLEPEKVLLQPGERTIAMLYLKNGYLADREFHPAIQAKSSSEDESEYFILEFSSRLFTDQ